MKGALTLAAVVSLTCAYAQNDSNKLIPNGYVCASYGVSIPVGAFQNNFDMPAPVGLYNNAVGEYAEVGQTVNINFGLPVKHSHFGIAGMLNYVQHGFNASEYIANQQAVRNSLTLIRNTNYSEYNAMLGLFTSFRLNKHISCDMSLLFGILFLRTPEVIDSGTLVYGLTYVQEGTWNLSSINTASFASNLNIGFRYQCSKLLCFSLRTDMYFAYNTFSSFSDALPVPLQFTDTKTGSVTNESGDLYLKMFLFNITAGIGIIIGN